MEIKAMVTHETNQLSLETVELDDPKATEVRVKMTACGVCHTDAAALAQFIPVKLPAIMGHEGVGIVDKIGDAVEDLKVGDHVIMTFPSCGLCPSCRRGHPYACKIMNPLMFDGTYKDGTKRLHQNGEDISSFFGQAAFATYSVVDSRNAIKVDPDVELAPLCSLGCGVQTGAGTVLNRIRPEPGTSIAVFGCGAVGMSAIMAAKIAGCSTIIGVDAVPSRLELAKELGATNVINGKDADAVAEIRKITDGGANYSVECSGVIALANQAIDCLGVEGTAVIVSVTGELEMKIKPEPMIMNPSRTFAGIVEGGSNPQIFIPKLVQYYKEGRLPIDKMTKYYKFEDIQKAFDDSHSGAVIKPILTFDK